MSTTTNLSTLKINYLTQAQYDEALANEEINENELYFTPSEEVFAIVNYGEDTFAEVQALYEQCDGRIICKKAGAVNGSYDYFPLVESSSTSFSFIGFYGSASCQFIMLSSTLGWSTTYRSIQKSITTSSSEPTSSDGVDGDIWVKYTV